MLKHFIFGGEGQVECVRSRVGASEVVSEFLEQFVLRGVLVESRKETYHTHCVRLVNLTVESLKT